MRQFTCVLLLVTFAATADADSRRRSAVPSTQTRAGDYTEGGYADRTSVMQGGEIALHIATRTSPFTLRIVNLSDPATVVHTVDRLTSAPLDCTDRYERGCGWPSTTTLRIPITWPSGFYAARFPTSAGERSLFFVVRSSQPASVSPILLVSATNTYQAYNQFGGKNVYPSNSPHRAFRVSFSRPYHDGLGLGLYPRWEQQLVNWMRGEGRTFEAASDTDMEDGTLLMHYRVVVFAGHAEYWTANARQNLEAFSQAGGHIAILGGNTMWWQARLEENSRALVVYKDALRDPVRRDIAALTTTNWYAPPVNRPENLILGASFRSGGFMNEDEHLVGYTVADPTSWVFAGANLRTGELFGRLAAGNEVDGALFNCDANGVPTAPDGSDGTPLNYHILATTPASEGHGTIGVYTNSVGGAVFNAGTRDWANALAADAVVATMTRNVLTRFSSGERLPYDPVLSAVRLRELFNCPMDSPRPFPGWRGSFGAATQSSRCAYEGPTGLEMGGSERVIIARSFSPTNAGLSNVEVRFRVNVDALSGPPGVRYDLVTLQNRGENNVFSRYARVAIVTTATGANALRMSRLNRTGGTEESSPALELTPGWHEVTFTFSSPGSLVMALDDKPPVTLPNPNAGQAPNEVQLFFPSPQDVARSGFTCLDALTAAIPAR